MFALFALLAVSGVNSEWTRVAVTDLNGKPVTGVGSSTDGMILAAVVGGGTGRSWTSSDGGASWEEGGDYAWWKKVSVSGDGSYMVKGCGELYACNLQHSTDGGATWSDSAGTANIVLKDLAISKIGAIGIAAAVPGSGSSTPQYLTMTGSYGASWYGATLPGTSTSWTSVSLSATGMKIVAADGAQGGPLKVSVDGGSNWDSRGIPHSQYWSSVAVSADGSTMVACRKDSNIYISVDNGTTWTNSGGACQQVSISDDGQKMVASPGSGNPYAMLYSDDNGVTWSSIWARGTMSDVQISGDGSLILAADNSGLTLYRAPTTTMVTTTSTTAATTATATTATATTATVTTTTTATATATATTDPIVWFPTTPVGGAVYSSLEVSMDMAVDDPSIINNSTVTDAMIDGFADVMAVDADDVTLDFIVNRRLSSTRKLSSTLTAIFTVVMESVEAAIEKQVAIETVSLQKTTEAISTAVASTGFTGTLVVTGKSTARVAAPTREDEVLDELQSLEQQRRGTFRRLESEFDVVGKVLSLWAFHQRQTLEDANPGQCGSLSVLRKVAALLQSLFLKLPPQRLLARLEEYQESEALTRIALATVHQNAQLRLQMAVNYAENNVIPVMVACLQLLLRGYERSESGADSVPEVEVAFQHLAEEKLPVDGWSYITFCLEVCLHVLSHWSCIRAAQTKAEALDPGAAPVRLASAGVVDVLAELIDAPAAGVELREPPSAAVVQKANETLQALFERNGHICLFCMKHYTEVKQILLVGCESIVSDPLSDHPQMQQEAIELFSGAFEKFAMKDERLGRKLLKALTVLFESSYQLVVWFLQQQPLGSLPETHSLDAHIEAVRAVARAGYWSAEDAPLLPEFVAALVSTMLDAVEGHLDFSKPLRGSGCRVIDLTEAEEIASSCTSSVLHLMLIDPSPPTVQRCLADCLGKRLTRKGGAGYLAQDKTDDMPPLEEVEPSEAPNSEEAVNTVMKIMQVFPSSDRLQMNCQHMLTSLLGE
ncbi:HCc2 [Symbiodinium natans]|uniref:HCc2 protein n=1 Tax=Symbiodinium natans TaxID=878477 RepID=A0A812PT61_9DINO|nr:HCc2 [Symbiodinium natans]